MMEFFQHDLNEFNLLLLPLIIVNGAKSCEKLFEKKEEGAQENMCLTNKHQVQVRCETTYDVGTQVYYIRLTHEKYKHK